MPILTVKTFFPRLGRIGAGYMTDTRADGSKAKAPFPQKSKTFVFHTDERDRADEIASVFGGKAEEAVSRDDEGGSFRVVTGAMEIECFVPSEDETGFDAWLEQWGAGGLIRRCDGETCQMAVVDDKGKTDAHGKPAQKVLRGVPCLCEAEHLPADQRCDATTRLNVIIAALREAKGVGVWQVQTRSLRAYRAIAGALDLTRNIIGRIAGVPFVLKISQERSRDDKGQGRTFPVISLHSNLSPSDMLRLASTSVVDVPRLPPPDRDQPVIGQRRDEADGEPEGAAAVDDGGQPGGASAGVPIPEPPAAEQPKAGAREESRPITPDEQRALVALAKELGIDSNRARAEMITIAHVEHSSKLSLRQLELLRMRLRAVAEARK